MTYIPKDLEDALNQLDELNTDDDRADIRSGTLGATDLHHGYGTSLRNNWELWDKSRLAKWFNSIGIFHADDMSGIILDAWFCRVRGQPFDLGAKVKWYQDFWREQGIEPMTGVKVKP